MVFYILTPILIGTWSQILEITLVLKGPPKKELKDKFQQDEIFLMHQSTKAEYWIREALARPHRKKEYLNTLLLCLRLQQVPCRQIHIRKCIQTFYYGERFKWMHLSSSFEVTSYHFWKIAAANPAQRAVSKLTENKPEESQSKAHWSTGSAGCHVCVAHSERWGHLHHSPAAARDRQRCFEPDHGGSVVTLSTRVMGPAN